jgi:hypothetical protein
MSELLARGGYEIVTRKRIIRAVTALRNADVVIARPSMADGSNVGASTLFAHVADLAGQAFRALQPPRWLVAHPGFAQVARRFDYVQLSEEQARLLGAGSIDVGTLAERLRQAQGRRGECAVIADTREGCLWADGRWWTIPPLGAQPTGNASASDDFCTAWVVARRFWAAKPAAAVHSAHKMATGEWRMGCSGTQFSSSAPASNTPPDRPRLVFTGVPG